jgi:hypothetical protein
MILFNPLEILTAQFIEPFKKLYGKLLITLRAGFVKLVERHSADNSTVRILVVSDLPHETKVTLKGLEKAKASGLSNFFNPTQTPTCRSGTARAWTTTSWWRAWCRRQRR